MRLRRFLLILAFLSCLYVGPWAAFFPGVFYTYFPGFGLHWIDSDGAYNDHLIRDVGGLYIGFGVACLSAAFSRSVVPGRVVGFGWAAFGVLHLRYHLMHPKGSTTDIVCTTLSLALSAVVGIVLLLPENYQTVTKKISPQQLNE